MKPTVACLALMLLVVGLAGGLGPFAAEGEDRAEVEAEPAHPTLENLRSQYDRQRGRILGIAALLDEQGYAFQPTKEVRSAGKILAHLADANYFLCSMMAGVDNPLGPEATPSDSNPRALENTLRGREKIHQALRQSYDFCDGIFGSFALQDLSQPKAEGVWLAPAGAALQQVTHCANHYGNLVVYLRLQGLKPPPPIPSR